LIFSLILGLLALGAVCYIMFVYDFLSVTKRVDADVLVVEGWVPRYVLPLAIAEYHRGGYSLILVSGLEGGPEAGQTSRVSEITRTTSRLEGLGMAPGKVVACPAPFARWHRTAKSARAVREKIHELGLHPRGINVITDGTHARETWTAYRNMFGDETPVGIICTSREKPPPFRWWKSRQRLFWVTVDFFGWLKEVIFPMH
jgi:hypothetical protein